MHDGKLTRASIDDDILTHFFEVFPEYKFDDALRELDENSMKSAKGKERWRDFILPVSSAGGHLLSADQEVREETQRLQLRYSGPQIQQPAICRGQLDPRHKSTVLRH